MASLNRILLIGNLGKDPELKYIPSGQAVCTLRLAGTEGFRTKAGEDKNETVWVDVVVWGKQGENCAQYLKKGRSAFVEGRLRIRDFEGRDGQKRYRTEVVANRVQFLGGPRDAGGGGGGGGGGGDDAVPVEAPAGGGVDEPLPAFDDDNG